MNVTKQLGAAVTNTAPSMNVAKHLEDRDTIEVIRPRILEQQKSVALENIRQDEAQRAFDEFKREASAVRDLEGLPTFSTSNVAPLAPVAQMFGKKCGRPKSSKTGAKKEGSSLLEGEKKGRGQVKEQGEKKSEHSKLIPKKSEQASKLADPDHGDIELSLTREETISVRYNNDAILAGLDIEFEDNPLWTEQDEAILQASWTNGDAEKLASAYSQERILWIRTAMVFRTFCPHIGPFGVDIYKKGHGDDESFASKNTDWQANIYDDLSTIMCNLIFLGNLDYFKFVLEMALYHRVMDLSCREEPELDAFDSTKENDFFADVESGLAEIGEGNALILE